MNSGDSGKRPPAARRPPSMEELRARSREYYLEKRESQKLQLLQASIADEEALFDIDQLTDEEKAQFLLKKKVATLASEKIILEEKERVHQYSMPESKLADLLILDYVDEKARKERERAEKEAFSRYEDRESKRKKVELPSKVENEEQKWEAHQSAKAGAVAQEELTEFEYLFDAEEHIKFILKSVSSLKQDESYDGAHRKVEHKEPSESQNGNVLPIEVYKDEFIDAMKNHQILIVVGETGSGKTTQIPQYILKAGSALFGLEGQDGQKAFRIGITQPRRVAAMSVAARVAFEMGVKLGREVGYSIRFEDCTSERTIVKYMTDGMLLREFLMEPDLASYAVIMIDEAHERSLHTDVLFGLIKDVARFRPDLKVLISSATLDAEKISRFFDDAPIFNIPGRRYPVEIFYCQSPEADYLSASITTIMQLHISQPLGGDILAFFTGQEEIEIVMESLQHIIKSLGKRIPELIVAPIYAALPSEMQANIFLKTPPGARKVVLATNIAETSITIDGIVYVIDPGLVKQKEFNPRTGIESLLAVPCSKASVNQRAGRAGRVGPGKCFRLYTHWTYENELEETTTPEIQRENLASTVLMLKVTNCGSRHANFQSLGIDDLINFDFLDPPPPESLLRALEMLYALGALSKEGTLTRLGRQMAEFPLDPMLSRTLIAGNELGVGEEVLSIVAMLSVQAGLFYKPSRERRSMADEARKAFIRTGGDHLSLLAVWEGWMEAGFSTAWCYDNFIQSKSMRRARDIRDQLVALMERVNLGGDLESNPNDTVSIRKAFVAGYFYHAARINRNEDGYKAIKSNQSIFIHPSSSLFPKRETKKKESREDQFRGGNGPSPPPKWVLYHELTLTSKEYMRQIIEIQPTWLCEAAPHFYTEKELEIDKSRPQRSRGH